MDASRGSIASFATYRPPLPVDMFSCPASPSSEEHDELHLTDGVSYNYNGRPIPPPALKVLVTKKPELASECGATMADVENGHANGLVFVSERENGLETLHVSLRFNGKVKVLSLADIYGADSFGGVRMEDSGCIAGGFAPNADLSLIYVSTKKATEKRRAPWTVVYRTSLITGQTERLTPEGQYDLSPAVSPSGTRVAVANFSGNRWDGEIEHLKTNIVVMNVDKKAQGGKPDRVVLIKDGGWPSWGSDNVIFFHRGIDKIKDDGKKKLIWQVLRYDFTTGRTDPVTTADFDAMTPAAINENKVAVATIRLRTNQMEGPREEEQYRHIEIFDIKKPKGQEVKVTQSIFPKADYYNPFVLDGGNRIGYHRGRRDMLRQQNGKSDVPRNFHKMLSPLKDVGMFRVSGVFPTISSDGSKLAFVDNEFKAVWLVDKDGLRVVHERRGPNSVFSTVWNQNPEKDILYVCVGPSFSADSPLEIYAIFNVSGTRGRPETRRLTDGSFNNAFPSSNPDGTQIVFRSTRDHTKSEFRYKNLYIMKDAHAGEIKGDGTVTRLTEGDWTDTHCQWSPRGDWIVFSSTRDKPEGKDKKYKLELDNGLDLGHFAVFLVAVSDPKVVVRVVTSADPGPGLNSIAGHVNHPIFSPDGRSIAFTSDLAAISAEPISMPMFLHSVRSYGDIFSVDIDPDNIRKNKDIKKFHRLTHSRYEYSTPAWTQFATDDPNAQWNMLVINDAKAANYRPACPYAHPDGGESWHMTGHLILPKRCC